MHFIILMITGFYISYLLSKLESMATVEEERDYLSTLAWLFRSGMSDPEYEKIRKRLVIVIAISSLHAAYIFWVVK